MPNRTRFPSANRNRGAARSDFAEKPPPQESTVTLPSLGLDLQEGAIEAPRVRPGSIHPQTLASRDQANIIGDPGFEEEPTRNSLTDGWSADAATVYEGLWSATATSDTTQKRYIIMTGVPIVATEKLLLSAAFRVATGSSAGAGTNPRLGVVWRNSAGASISESYVDEGTYDATFRVREAIVAAPANTVTFDLYQELPAAMTTAKATYIDKRVCRKMLSFRSATSGARGELDLNGLRAYNSGGTATVNIDFSNGAAFFSGTITASDFEAIDFDPDVTVRINDGDGFHWTDSADANVFLGQVHGVLTNDANKYNNQSWFIVETDHATYQGGTNARSAFVTGDVSYDKTAAADHYAQLLFGAFRGDASTSATKIRIIDSHATPANSNTLGSYISLEHTGDDGPGKLYINLEPQGNGTNSKYAAGSQTWTDRQTSAVNLSSTDNTEVTLVDRLGVTVIKDRRYQIIGSWPRWAKATTSSTTAATTQLVGFILYSGTTQLKECRVSNAWMAATEAAGGGTVVTDWVATADGTVDFILKGTQRGNAAGGASPAGTTSVNASSNNPIEIQVVDVGF
jgi:hypothetical protein